MTRDLLLRLVYSGQAVGYASRSERRLALEALGVQVRVYSNRITDGNGDPHPRGTVMLGSVR